MLRALTLPRQSLNPALPRLIMHGFKKHIHVIYVQVLILRLSLFERPSFYPWYVVIYVTCNAVPDTRVTGVTSFVGTIKHGVLHNAFTLLILAKH